MKKAVVQVRCEAEKLQAVEKYMEKKEVSLEEELSDTLQKMYEKHVPPAVREYIESRVEEMPAAKKKTAVTKETEDSVL